MQFLSLGYCWKLLSTCGRENDQVRSRYNKTAEKCISTVVKNAQSYQMYQTTWTKYRLAKTKLKKKSKKSKRNKMKSITVTRPCESKEAHVAGQDIFRSLWKILLLVCLCTNIQAISFDSAELISRRSDKCEGIGVDVSEGFWLQVWRRPSSEERRQLQPVFGQLCNSRKRVIWAGFPLIVATRNVRVSEEMQIYSVPLAYFAASNAYV